MSWRKKKVELNCSLDKDYMLAGSSRVMTAPQNVLQGLNGLAFVPMSHSPGAGCPRKGADSKGPGNCPVPTLHEPLRLSAGKQVFS